MNGKGQAMFRKKRPRLELTDCETVVDLSLPEFDDVHDDQFGRPFGNLYREVRPDFEKTHREAVRAVEWLMKHFFKA
jgi:hypothetical protein